MFFKELVAQGWLALMRDRHVPVGQDVLLALLEGHREPLPCGVGGLEPQNERVSRTYLHRKRF